MNFILNFILKIKQLLQHFTNYGRNYTEYDDIIGIDFGTSKIVICNKKEKIKLKEASRVAFLDENGIRVPYLFGEKAKEMTGKTPLKIEICCPIKRGVVYDFEMTEEMMKNFLSKISNNNFFIKPRAVVGIPFGASPSEKKLIQETLEKCGIKETLLIYKNMADAIGCELPINKPVGFMIVNIGEGTTDISVISLGGIVIGMSIPVAGNQMTKDIVDYIKNKYGILIGETKAEWLKKQISSVFVKNENENLKINLKGRDIKTGNPTEITLTSRDCSIALAKTIYTILLCIIEVIEKTPAELATDIADNGILLCGGGANIKNIDFLISIVTCLPVFILPDPEFSGIKGIYKVLKEYKKYEHTLFKVL